MSGGRRNRFEPGRYERMAEVLAAVCALDRKVSDLCTDFGEFRRQFGEYRAERGREIQSLNEVTAAISADLARAHA
jgi:uncharacterized protein with von Willebrand factor type A (vWA) domain